MGKSFYIASRVLQYFKLKDIIDLFVSKYLRCTQKYMFQTDNNQNSIWLCIEWLVPKFKWRIKLYALNTGVYKA